MNEVKLGALIRGHRKLLKLTQKQLAEKLDVGESTVRMWELGKNYPTVPKLLLTLNILEIPIEKLIDQQEGQGNESNHIKSKQRRHLRQQRACVKAAY